MSGQVGDARKRDAEPQSGDVEALVTAIAAAINYQSFDARAGLSDLLMAEEIVHITNAGSAPGGVKGWLAAHDAEVRREAKAERDAAREALARATSVLREWGAIADEGDFVGADDFAEAIHESGAWRLARDIRAALVAQPQHECDSGHFDRTICPEPCGTMHSFCATCGKRADACAHEPATDEGAGA